MATMQLPGTGYGLRYEYGMFKQSIVDGWQKRESRQLASGYGDPWEIARLHERVEIKLNVSFKCKRVISSYPRPTVKPDRYPV